MTGYGGATKRYGGFIIQFEIKSVNHRYGEVVIRMPREWSCYEDGLRRLVLSHLKRGRIDVFINKEYEEDHLSPLRLNTPVLEAYIKAASEIGVKYGTDPTMTTADLLSLPEVMTADSSAQGMELSEALEHTLQEGLSEAIQGLVAMREQEGNHLAQDIANHLTRLEEIHAELITLAPEVVKDYRSRLEGRLSELMEGALDEQRFAMEVAIFADRSNVDEELIRLKSHFEQCRGLLQSCEPVGRKLDFLIQEMNRETNTIGSKANHLALVNRVVEMKAELEKIREQAANIE